MPKKIRREIDDRRRLLLDPPEMFTLFDKWSAAVEFTHTTAESTEMVEHLVGYLAWRADENTTDASLQEYLDTLAKKNQSAASRTLVAFKSIFSHHPSKPAEKLKIKITRVPRSNLALTEEQCQAVIGFLRLEEYKLLAHIMHETGLSLIDACNLEWKHVDFSVPCITGIRSKTREAFRVPIRKEGELHRILQEMYPERNSEYVEEANHMKYRTKVGSHGIDRSFRLAMDKAGVPAGTSTHGFRRAFVSNLIRANIHPSVIIKMTGHTSVDKLQHYARSGDDELVTAIESSHAHVSNTKSVPQPGDSPVCQTAGTGS